MALDHASLGQIQGVRASQHLQVEQYLGIQYAKLANGFARGSLVEKPQTPVDATAIGQVWLCIFLCQKNSLIDKTR